MRLRARSEPQPQAAPESEPHVVAFEAFGVPFRIELPAPEFDSRVRAILPPGALPIDAAPEENEFRLVIRDRVKYFLAFPGGSVPGSSDIDIALEILGSKLRAFVAAEAPDYLFVNASVVEHDGRAILILGPTFSGKTSLVAELVRNGATFYSDEFAVLDADGLVHPYVKPSSTRINGARPDHDVTLLGGVGGHELLPVGTVILSRYEPGAVWDPQPLSPGEAVLAVLSNMPAAEKRPEQALTVVRKALQGAVALDGMRGEAAQVVDQLFESLPV